MLIHKMIELKQCATNINTLYLFCMCIYINKYMYNIKPINLFNLPELPNPAPEGPRYDLLAETTSPVLVEGVTAQMKTTSTLAYLHLALNGS